MNTFVSIVSGGMTWISARPHIWLIKTLMWGKDSEVRERGLKVEEIRRWRSENMFMLMGGRPPQQRHRESLLPTIPPTRASPSPYVSNQPAMDTHMRLSVWYDSGTHTCLATYCDPAYVLIFVPKFNEPLSFLPRGPPSLSARLLFNSGNPFITKIQSFLLK